MTTEPTKMTTHSSLPWKIVRGHPDPKTAESLIEIFPATGGWNGEFSSQEIAMIYCAKEGSIQAADADLIVRAVNNHAALLAALKEMCGALEDTNSSAYQTLGDARAAIAAATA